MKKMKCGCGKVIYGKDEWILHKKEEAERAF
jgi:hypothetical protein